MTCHPTIAKPQRVLVVDEIQKLPLLLDEIQLLLDRNRDLRVVLTGSSARKLKRGAANLLGGRAWISRLHPVVSPEVGPGRLLERLERGGCPPSSTRLTPGRTSRRTSAPTCARRSRPKA